MESNTSPETIGSSDDSAPSGGAKRQRLKAVCVITDGSEYLFAVGTDPAGPPEFLIPVGGGIEFAEFAAAAAVREVMEETGLVIRDARLLGVLENIFTWNGGHYHEVVFCFIAPISSRDIAPFEGRESNGESFPLRWLSMEEIVSSPVPVYPDGIVKLMLSEPLIVAGVTDR